ncbi:flagellar biosynthesis protein FlhF [Alteribacter keqinensis]|uniref:Flagellar biosynthesis protein FlhF n=1 Tax=Alteribacter keqinensis TaxID=2483800 RepID=A0A3M7TVH1_9BACI|nr:flagellar biosynthesis protein FlhF [Alteribacter keqinensis]RNA69577.1 flagellar biosynthesis protein FlhF [Alteribacter keqinensis]
MKVKKYQADDMPEAMIKIKQELGKDAVILHSKTIEIGGFLGFFTKKKLEVIAAADPEPVKPVKKPLNTAPPAVKEETGDLKMEVAALRNSVTGMHLKTQYPQPLQPLYEVMCGAGLSWELTDTCMNSAVKRWYKEDSPRQPDLRLWMQQILEAEIPDEPFLSVADRKKYINLVGPTGVGKTTTLAKMASHALLHEKKTIGFITTDTYRIAAVEQLKTYARILNVTVEVAYSLEDFKKACEKLADKDVVFIDTAGRNYQDSEYIKQLKSTLDFSSQIETHLVLSLTSKYEDMKEIIDQFKAIGPEYALFTKWDETKSHGAVLNVLSSHNMKVSYITTGQDVPDDIKKADKTGIIEEMVNKCHVQ